jgi:hypothetical protein
MLLPGLACLSLIRPSERPLNYNRLHGVITQNRRREYVQSCRKNIVHCRSHSPCRRKSSCFQTAAIQTKRTPDRHNTQMWLMFTLRRNVISLLMRHSCIVSHYLPSNIIPSYYFVSNPILFTICTSTLSKLCKNMYIVACRRVLSSAPLYLMGSSLLWL